MKVHKVAYSVRDKAAYDQGPTPVPEFIAAEDLTSALAEAKKFETDNVFLRVVELMGEVVLAQNEVA